MDVEEETAKFKWLLIGLIAFVVSGCYSYSELKYFIVGKTAEGTVKQCYTIEERGRRGRTRDVLIVEYSYKDQDGKVATTKERFAAGSKPPAEGTRVKLEYLAGSEDSARLAGRRNWIAVGIFAVCAAAMSWFVISIWREGTEDTRKKAPPARKPIGRR